MPEFNLAALLADSVSELDTKQEYIEYIPREQIHEDPNNFYSMDGLQELASNISLCGLLDPIRVRSVDDGYCIVSGHRRFAAMGLLVADGDKRFALIPCIVEKSNISPAMQELRLIYANSDTRKLSSADLNKQVERITELLYQLQEEGYSFPGRMRDHVAEACKLSKTKIARLDAIRNGLCAEAKALYEANKINETVAYTLATIPTYRQHIIVNSICSVGESLYEGRVKSFASFLEDIAEQSCKKGGGKCTHLAGKADCKAKNMYSYVYCTEVCCAKCKNLAKCKHSCPLVAQERKKVVEKAKTENATKRQQAKQEKADALKKDQQRIDRLTAIFKNIAKIARRTGVAPKSLSQHLPQKWREREFLECMRGCCTSIHPTDSILNTGVCLYALDAAICMADELHISLDELFMHDTHAVAAPELTWETGEPTEPGMYAAQVFLKDADVVLSRIIYLLPGSEEFSLTAGKFTPIDAKAVHWIKLPDHGGGTEDAGD